MISNVVDGASEHALIRNIRHSDIHCPYDLLDGWEVITHCPECVVEESWEEDVSLSVTCVHPEN